MGSMVWMVIGEMEEGKMGIGLLVILGMGMHINIGIIEIIL